MLLHSDKLFSVDKDLVKLATEVGKRWDIIIATGFRNEEDQNKAFAAGKSKLKWGQSDHNKSPSRAIDVYSYSIMEKKIDFSEKTAAELRDHFEEVAKELRIKLKPIIAWDLGHISLAKV